jgi:hypothetical protein
VSPVNVTEPALLVRITRLFRESLQADAPQEATRGVWRLGWKRNSVLFALAVASGVGRDTMELLIELAERRKQM